MATSNIDFVNETCTPKGIFENFHSTKYYVLVLTSLWNAHISEQRLCKMAIIFRIMRAPKLMGRLRFHLYSPVLRLHSLEILTPRKMMK